MGSWHTYHLTVHPGERDPERVAAELRGALPAALLGAAHDSFDLDDIVHGDGPDVWVADGLVHFATGRNWRVSTFDWSPTLVPALPVPARWACAVWQQEVEYNGGAELFGWVDGGFVPVDEQQGLFGNSGRDALRVLEREWGVTGSTDRDVPRNDRSDADDPIADPESVPKFEPVDRDALGDPEDALATLTDADRGGAERRRAAERLYVHVAERDAAVRLDPRLFAALDDDATKWAAGATVRELSVTTGALADALAADDAERRRAAARFCLLRADEPSRDDAAVFPAAVLADALADADRAVRLTAARAFERSVVSELADPPTAAFDALADAATDDDPDIRAAATLALVRSGFDHRAGDFETVADAFARAVFAPDPTVRDRLEAYLDTSGDDLGHFLPDSLVERLAAALVRADAQSDRAAPDAVDGLVTYPAHYQPEVVDPVVTAAVELGWGADSTLARSLVSAYVDGHDDEYAADHDRGRRLHAAFDAAGIDLDRADVPDLPEPEGPDPEDPSARTLEPENSVPEGPRSGESGTDPSEGDETNPTDGSTGESPSDGRASDASSDEPSDHESSGLLDWLPFR